MSQICYMGPSFVSMTKKREDFFYDFLFYISQTKKYDLHTKSETRFPPNECFLCVH